MNTAKRVEIANKSRYSYHNTHNGSYVLCNNCKSPLTKAEYSAAIDPETGKIVESLMPESCSACPSKE